MYPNLFRMAITIFSIPPMSAGPERVFSGAKHTIAPERVRLGAKMLEMAESIKSWVRISKVTGRAPLSRIFTNSHFVNEALKVLEQEGVDDEIVVLPRTQAAECKCTCNCNCKH